MENSIKSEREQFVIREKYLNDNNLLQAVGKKNSIIIRLLFISQNCVKEQVLVSLSKEDFRDIDKIVQLNDCNDTIAINSKVGDKYQLTRLYDIEDHSFANSDFIDLVYKDKFLSVRCGKQLKKNNGG